MSVWSGLQPLMQTRPAEEVSTQADHCILSGVQTYVALKGAVLVAAVGRVGAAGPGAGGVRGRGGAGAAAGDRRGGSGGHLQLDPGTRRHRWGGNSAGTQRLKTRSWRRREAQWSSWCLHECEKTKRERQREGS